MLKSKAIKLVAKTAVVNEEGKILVLTRSETDPSRPGGLDFPGGEIELGEDVLEGASREIKEEVGVDLPLSELQIIYSNTADRNESGVVIIRFLCMAAVKNPLIQLSYEHSDFQWMTLAEVIEQFDSISWATGLRFGAKNGIFTNNLQ